VRVAGLQEHVLGDTRSSLVLLLAAVGVLLLMACTNVASLQLARTIGRTRELAVRSALGAEKSRLVRQFLVENLLLALIGGAVGLVVGYAGLRIVSVPIADALPQIRDVAVDRWVLGFTFILSCGASGLFGLLPVLRSNDIAAAASASGSGGRGATAGGRQARSQNALVVLQVALALVMLVSAGLLVRSLAHLHDADAGFNPDHLLTVTISLPQSEYPNQERWLAFNGALLDRVRQTPGVEAAALGVSVSFLGTPTALPIEIEGHQAANAVVPMADVSFASDGYFRAMQIPVVRGREFAATDRRETLRVAVVNQAFAKRFLGDREVVGRRIHVGPPKGVWVEIVGIVGDTAQTSLVTPPPALLYMPYAQRPFWITSFVIRTSRDPQSMAPSLRKEVASMAPGVPVLAIEPMNLLLQRSFAASSHRTLVLVLFGGLAAILAAIGIHGLVAYTVATRTNEIGIRLALGAEPSRVRRAVLGQGVRLAGIGISLGLAMSLALTRLLDSLLFGVSSTDPLTFLGGIALLIVVAAAACYAPARRATRVDPLTALRCE
jgi:putative ABC transport system permease protein